MKIGRMAVAVVGCALVASVAQAAPANRQRGVNARQQRQAQRIHNGVKNDELTRGERDRLSADEAAIRAKERVYRRSGDGLNANERRDLEHDLNKTSREIYRDKHNDRTPPPE
ncbi:MAG TPA: hypothetical protein VH583_19230 [Vicinamibacterales bacterium]|jgi:hypothetical protein